MKNIWKWILGIVLVVAVVAGLLFVFHNKLAMNFAYRNMPNHPGWQAPRNGPPIEGRSPGERKPMIGGDRHGGFMPFHDASPFHHGGSRFYGPGFMILGGLMRLVPLALLALLLVVAYQLGKRANMLGATAPALASAPAPSPTHPCPKCGSPVQDDWTYCPACGKKQ